MNDPASVDAINSAIVVARVFSVLERLIDLEQLAIFASLMPYTPSAISF